MKNISGLINKHVNELADQVIADPEILTIFKRGSLASRAAAISRIADKAENYSDFNFNINPEEVLKMREIINVTDIQRIEAKDKYKDFERTNDKIQTAQWTLDKAVCEMIKQFSELFEDYKELIERNRELREENELMAKRLEALSVN